MTARALDAIGVPYHVIIEEQEYSAYAQAIDARRLLVLDKAYQRGYDTCDSLGDTKSKGPGAARNFAWDHSISRGSAWHWVMDDNINGFYRLHRNLKVPVGDGTVIKCMEDFCLRYRNVAMAGPNYDYFVKRKVVVPPYVLNTRIYSCNLIRNDVPYRWRGRYNEDTDLSLRMLTDRWCTVQFNAFLQCKRTTQTMRGGNTDEFYAKEGTLAKSRMIAALHPHVARVVWKFGRWHHHVDYKPFRDNRLVRDERVSIDDRVNNYGMTLQLNARTARS